MLRLLKLSAPLFAIAALLTLSAITSADEGEDLSLKDVNLGTHVHGPEVKAEDLSGKIVIFEYWGDRCPPCIASIPHIVELRKEYGADKLVIVANQVWTENVDAAKKAWVDNGGSDDISVVNHGAIQGAEVRGVPHAFVFDQNGELLWRGNPHPRADGAKLDEVVKEAVGSLPGQN